MFDLSANQVKSVSGALVTVAGYSFETPGVDQNFAEILAASDTWDVTHGNLIGITCQDNPYNGQVMNAWSCKGAALYYHFLKKAVPSSFYHGDGFFE